MNAIAPTASAVTDRTAELLHSAQTGDGQAFTEIVELHHPELVRIAYAITGDLDAARDAAQSAWIKAWSRLRTVREPERLRVWLVAIAANEARQNIRAAGRRRIREVTPAVEGAAARKGDPEAAAARLDLGQALLGLAPGDRQLLAMRYLAGMSADEIATATGRSASGTRTRLSRLVARLREELGDD